MDFDKYPLMKDAQFVVALYELHSSEIVTDVQHCRATQIVLREGEILYNPRFEFPQLITWIAFNLCCSLSFQLLEPLHHFVEHKHSVSQTRWQGASAAQVDQGLRFLGFIT